jgi:hypothetical protein
LVAGRDFAASDGASAAPVVIVNEALAARLWPGQRPVGQSLFLGDTALGVVGVAANTKYVTPTEAPRPFFYLPIEQYPAPRPSMLVRTSGEAAAIAAEVRSVLGELPEPIVASGLETMDAVVGASFGQQVVFARVVGLFGLTAMLLALAGAYGVTSYRVSQRTAEIGIRMALGARRHQVTCAVIRGTFIMAVIGVVIGTLLAAAATPALAGLIPGVTATDAPTFLIATFGLLMAVTLAGLAPALRASRVDPLIAVRRDP